MRFKIDNMSILVNLYCPKGFKDSDKYALNPSTGELIKWKWKNLKPEDFSVDQDGNIFHNCNDKQNWSRVVRHGQSARNFFEKKTSLAPRTSRKKAKMAYPSGSKFNISYKGKVQLRKKKYRNTKYKNSRRRSIVQDKKQRGRNKKRKREKAFKRAVASNKVTVVPEVDVCFHCLVTSESDNIFNCPLERHCCDFCDKKFDGARQTCKVCDYCLHRAYRTKFCEDCIQNLGEWHVNWRMQFNIPQQSHPQRCNCQECFEHRWVHPCADCGNENHTAQYCPWGSMADTNLLAENYEWEYHARRLEWWPLHDAWWGMQ